MDIDVEAGQDLCFGLSEDEILKWSTRANVIPLPDYYCPTGGAPLSEVDDDVLLTAPPHVIVHIQRTAAQGGLQVVSPRQTPFSALMDRMPGGARMIGDHVVGVVAEPDTYWPTIDDADMSDLLPDQPIPPVVQDKSVRTKTRTLPLTAASHVLSDPILACLVKGRAVIDILRREDVMGGADELTAVLAKAWGVECKEIDDLDAFSLGIGGPMLRHAIKADEVYPTTYAPIHIRRSVSVGCSDVNRHYLPDNTAMDWRRMRTHCEAVFTLSCAIEGYPMQMMKARPPPGDPTAPSNRPNVLVFQPAGASAWSYDGSTFAITPTRPPDHMKASAIPAEVLDALARYVRVARPMSYALVAGVSTRAKKSVMVGTDYIAGETIATSYKMMIRCLVVSGVRGKTAAAAVRNTIFQAIENASLLNRMRVVRYIMIARDEAKAHLSLDMVPDVLIERLASKFLAIGDEIRLKIAAEATRRGHSIEEWWGDITAQAPERYSLFAEGTRGWAMVGMWLMFRSPTDRWKKLVSATHYGALREAQRSAVGGLRLPAEKGTPERLLAACVGAVRNITKAYAAYYMGVADVGLALADVAVEMSRPRTALMLREAAYMWVLRARAFRGTNIHLTGKDVDEASENYYKVKSTPADIVIKPAPYRAFEAYKSHVENSEILASTYKKHVAGFKGSVISDCFEFYRDMACPAKKSTLTQYLICPPQLSADMEASWQMLKEDVKIVAKKYGSGERSRSSSPASKKVKYITGETIQVNLRPDPEGAKDFYTVQADMGEDEVEWIEDLFEKMGPAFEEEVTKKKWVDAQQLRRFLIEAARERPDQYRIGPESVH